MGQQIREGQYGGLEGIVCAGILADQRAHNTAHEQEQHGEGQGQALEALDQPVAHAAAEEADGQGQHRLLARRVVADLADGVPEVDSLIALLLLPPTESEPEESPDMPPTCSSHRTWRYAELASYNSTGWRHAARRGVLRGPPSGGQANAIPVCGRGGAGRTSV